MRGVRPASNVGRIDFTNDERVRLLEHLPLRSRSDEELALAHLAFAVSIYRSRKDGRGWAEHEPLPSKSTVTELRGLAERSKALADALATISDEAFGELCLADAERLCPPGDDAPQRDIFAAFADSQDRIGSLVEEVTALAAAADAARRRAESQYVPRTGRPRDTGARFLASRAGEVWRAFSAEPMRRTDRGTDEPSRWERFLEAVATVAGVDMSMRRHARSIFDEKPPRT